MLIKFGNLMSEYQYILRNQPDTFYYSNILFYFILLKFFNITSKSDIWLALCLKKACFIYENL